MSVNTFGIFLRARRLGYGHFKEYQSFVRITPNGDDTYTVSIWPDTMLIKDSGRRRESHVCWWDGANPLLSSPAIMRRLPCTEPLEFIVGDDGEEFTGPSSDSAKCNTLDGSTRSRPPADKRSRS